MPRGEPLSQVSPSRVFFLRFKSSPQYIWLLVKPFTYYVVLACFDLSGPSPRANKAKMMFPSRRTHSSRKQSQRHRPLLLQRPVVAAAAAVRRSGLRHALVVLLVLHLARRNTSQNLLLLPAAQAQCDGLTSAQQRHCQPYMGYNTDSSQLTPPLPIEDGDDNADGGGTDDKDPVDKDNISTESGGGASNATIIAASIGGTILLAAAYLVRRRVASSDDELEDEEEDATTLGPNQLASSSAPGPVVVKRWQSDIDGEDAPTTVRGNIPPAVGPSTADLAAAAYQSNKNNNDDDDTNDLVDVPFQDDDDQDADMVSSSGSSSSDANSDEMEEVMARDRVWVSKMENV